MSPDSATGTITRIGVFDSGVGGLTVLAALRARFPHLDYVYYGDTANLPYGTKSEAQVVRLSRACARSLRSEKVDLVVVACNTASALALDAIRQELGEVPVLGVVEPGVEAALEAVHSLGEDGNVLVLATRATVRSGAYTRALSARGVAVITEQACPLLVPLIEEDWCEHPVLALTLEEYVRDHRRLRPSGVALLGCTHYPWIFDAFVKALPGYKVVNSASAVAEGVATRFRVATSESVGRLKQTGQVTWMFSDPDAVPTFASQWISAESLSRG